MWTGIGCLVLAASAGLIGTAALDKREHIVVRAAALFATLVVLVILAVIVISL